MASSLCLPELSGPTFHSGVLFEWIHAAGFCYPWEPALIWLHVASDSLIALAYFSIPIALIHFVQIKARCSILLDVRVFGRFHRGMRLHACDGYLDAVGSFLLAFGRGQGDYGAGFGTDGNFPGSAHANGIATPQPRGNEDSQ